LRDLPERGDCARLSPFYYKLLSNDSERIWYENESIDVYDGLGGPILPFFNEFFSGLGIPYD
jgi:hypothetical protein